MEMLSNMMAVPQNTPSTTLRKFIIGVVLGITLCAVADVVHQIPIISHQKWLQRGSAYDVESEYDYCLVLGTIRNLLSKMHFSRDNFLISKLRDWQQEETNKAFAKIPAADGERIIWKIWLSNEDWEDTEETKRIPKTTSLSLQYFDNITTMPMASKWAHDIDRFYYASAMADYFFKNSGQSGMSEEAIDIWRWKILRRLMELTPQFDVNKFYSSPLFYEFTEPLRWNYIIGIGASYILYNATDNTYNCNNEATNALFTSRVALQKQLKIYQSKEIERLHGKSLPSSAHKIVQKISNDTLISEAALEEGIRKNCPNLAINGE